MVKVRGVNVFTEAIGVTVAADERTNGEFFCVIEPVGESGREELTVMVEVPNLAEHGAAVKADLERRLKEVIGLRTSVEAGRSAWCSIPYTGAVADLEDQAAARQTQGDLMGVQSARSRRRHPHLPRP